MSLYPQIRKFIFPVLKRQGFEKIELWWRLQKNDDWLIQVETKSSKFGDNGLYHLEIDIGFYSHVLDDLMGWGRQAGYTERSPIPMPGGMTGCHMWASLFDLDCNGAWSPAHSNLFLPKGKMSETRFVEIASKLDLVIPAAFKRYASYESIIECKKKKIGQESLSKHASMYAAAACIKLGRYDEARDFLDDAVRPGSMQFMKDVGARLQKKISEAG